MGRKTKNSHSLKQNENTLKIHGQRNNFSKKQSVYRGKVLKSVFLSLFKWQTMEKEQFLNLLINEFVAEKRSKRRWRVFRWVLILLLIVGIVGLTVPSSDSSVTESPHVALIKLNGEIKNDQSASAENLIKAFNNAFASPKTTGIILEVNSPGGSPVQAGAVFDEIMRLKRTNADKRVIAVIEDVGASGAYYIAAAADEIFVHPSSLVGSIGVIMSQFGLDKVIEKLGIEQRTITAGKNKAFLDPFSPENPAQKAHAERLVANIHTHFKNAVKAGRGERLKENDEIFSGLVWTGDESIALGLADKIGQVRDVQRTVFNDAPLKDYTVETDLAQRVMKHLGVQFRTEMAAFLKDLQIF